LREYSLSAVDGPPDEHLAIGDRERAIFVRELERYLGPVDRSALFGPAEDRFVHPRSPDHCGALFPEHPAKRVRNI
jgi:hypothetical protein